MFKQCYKRLIVMGVLFAFLGQMWGHERVFAQDLNLPLPGTRIHLSPAFNPSILKGIKVDSHNPFHLEFLMSQGDSSPDKQETSKLVKYFLASLTIPEKDLWVNLSPYEKNRIVPDAFGQTQMGRDVLAQDYMLKQLTASLVYPEDEIGKKFWKRIYEESSKRFGNINLPVNTFNKVWIVPDKAIVYESTKGRSAEGENAHVATAYVVESKLKVLTEEDYVALNKFEERATLPITSIERQHNLHSEKLTEVSSQIIREIIIPELTREVNTGKNFAQLRQVYNSFILAAWYKKKIKESILNQVYSNHNKISGVNIDDPQEKQKIYERYLQAFKKGAFNYIRQEKDPLTEKFTPRKYFSGGARFSSDIISFSSNSAMVGEDEHPMSKVDLMLSKFRTDDFAMGVPLKDFEAVSNKILIVDKVNKIQQSDVIAQIEHIHRLVFKSLSNESIEMIRHFIGMSKIDAKYALAVDDNNRNKIVGYIFYVLSGEHNKNISIQYLAVTPEYQKRKIGVALMQYVFNKAKELKISNVNLFTAGFDNPAVDFYMNLPNSIPGIRVNMTGFEGRVYISYTIVNKRSADNVEISSPKKSLGDYDPAMNTDPLVKRMRRSWEEKLKESSIYWKSDPRFDFAYNYKAPSIAYDPTHIPNQKVGMFNQVAFSDLPERNDLDFVPEDLISNDGRRGLERELRNVLITDPDNSDLVVVPARWPMAKHHSLVISKNELPQQETSRFVLSSLRWAQRGLAVEFHKRGDGIDYYHLQLFDRSDAPIMRFINKQRLIAKVNEVSLVQLEGWPVVHFAIVSSNIEKLQKATMEAHQLLDKKNLPYSRDILRDKNGQLVVLFFIFSKKPVGFRFNTIGEVRSDNFNLNEDDIKNGLKEMLVSQDVNDVVRNEFWAQWIKANAAMISVKNNKEIYSELVVDDIDAQFYVKEHFFSFKDFMQEILHNSKWGYYGSGRVNIGRPKEGGHFLTSPVRFSPYFGQMMAEHAFRIWQSMKLSLGNDIFDVVEFGAGNAKLAEDFLDYVNERAMDNSEWMQFAGKLRYRIYEIAAGLREKQKMTLARFGKRVEVLEGDARNPSKNIPDNSIKGFIFSNEVPDAFGVHKIILSKDKKYSIAYVAPRIGVDFWKELVRRGMGEKLSQDIVQMDHQIRENLSLKGNDPTYYFLSPEVFKALMDFIVELNLDESNYKRMMNMFDVKEIYLPLEVYEHGKIRGYLALKGLPKKDIEQLKLQREAKGNSEEVVYYFNEDAGSFIQGVSRILSEGYVLTVDYGYRDLLAHEAVLNRSPNFRTYPKKPNGNNNFPYVDLTLLDMTTNVDFLSLLHQGQLAGLNTVFFGHEEFLTIGMSPGIVRGLSNYGGLSAEDKVFMLLQKATGTPGEYDPFKKRNIPSLDRSNKAQLSERYNGGIDLSSDKTLSIKNEGEGIQFHLDPAQLAQWQNSPGIKFDILSITPVGNLKQFLGILN